MPAPAEAIALEIPAALKEESKPEKVVSRLLREGISFRELDPSLGVMVESRPLSQESLAKQTEADENLQGDLASQLLASVRELDGFEDYELPTQSEESARNNTGVSRRSLSSSSVPRLYSPGLESSYKTFTEASLSNGQGRSNNARGALATALPTDKSRPADRRSSGGGGVGGVGGTRTAPVAPGVAFAPPASGNSGNNSAFESTVFPTSSQIAEAISSSPVLASTTSVSSNSIGATVDSSGRPVVRADGKYGIPNAQYWRFGFNDENSDGVVNQQDATLDFERYLVELEGLLEDENQVVKYSPNELRSIYDDLNGEIDTKRSDASPSYLTFMIIEFPIKGFHLAQEDIPGDNPNFGIH